MHSFATQWTGKVSQLRMGFPKIESKSTKKEYQNKDKGGLCQQNFKTSFISLSLSVLACHFLSMQLSSLWIKKADSFWLSHQLSFKFNIFVFSHFLPVLVYYEVCRGDMLFFSVHKHDGNY